MLLRSFEELRHGLVTLTNKLFEVDAQSHEHQNILVPLWKKVEWDMTFKQDSWWQSDKCLCFVGEDLKRCLFYPFLVISIVHHLGTLCDSATFQVGISCLALLTPAIPAYQADDMAMVAATILMTFTSLCADFLYIGTVTWDARVCGRFQGVADEACQEREEKRFTGFGNSSAKSEVRLFSFWTNIVHRSSI